MDAKLEKNEIIISTGAQISFEYKADGSYQNVEIVQNDGPNKFLALFEHDNVDFIVKIYNASQKRGLGFILKTLGKEGDFYLPPYGYARLETFESGGEKLHFINQKSSEGKQLVGLAAKKFNITQHDASVQISQMQLLFEVEKEKEKKQVIVSELQSPQPKDCPLKGQIIEIYVKELTGRTSTIKVGVLNTIEDLKCLIQLKTYTPPDQQRLVYAGNQLEDERTLNEYPIVDESTIHMILRLRGGGGPPVCSRSSLSETVKNAEPSKECYERGAICFGEKSDQTFDTYNKFVADNSFVIPPITIEFLMKTKLKI